MRWVALIAALVLILIAALVVSQRLSQVDSPPSVPVAAAVVSPAPPPRAPLLPVPAAAAPPPPAPAMTWPVNDEHGEADPAPIDAGFLLPATREGLQRAVAERALDINACFAELAEHEPRQRRRIPIEYRLAEANPISGYVTSVKVNLDSNDNALALQRCVQKALREARFQPPRHGWDTIRSSLVFNADGGL